MASILGIPLTATTYDAAISDLLSAATTSGAHRRAHFVTVHSLIEATRSPALAQAFASASATYMDGVPLTWVAHRQGIRAERVCGPDVMLSLCDKGQSVGLRHFFFGARPEVLSSLVCRLTERYPRLIVAGHESPPFRHLGPIEDAALVRQINATRPDVVWVGLGSPKQDLWAADHDGLIDAALILPVGAAFDFHSGRLRRAPQSMQRLGLEWLFRLAMDPRRLFRRYLVTNARFLALILADQLRRRLSGARHGRQ